ncbi:MULTISPECIES: hypothetical protein [Micromonospora]|uniref:Uncharacterized protein n=1 Tax=Micromonospora yangpuensis TaxID=683228 RepID=A0A1C6UT33_9ACTN|nr:hypothetical protein [Micromonospora yangpuensis]GGM29038.1 hypothetical protein GCM10012279_54670 [Micromonospora yangpuensis]SCL57168.1 hypothetical protein GA0070617_3450 [Micromonospora yangpuensis]
MTFTKTENLLTLVEWRASARRNGEGRERPVIDLAYLDAGSGSLIVQAVVGGAAGVAVATKLYWRRLVARFRRQRTDQN